MCVMAMSISPGPVCSAWTAGSVHHEDPPNRLGNGTAVMSSSDLRCQMWWGKKVPSAPKTCIHTLTSKSEEGRHKEPHTQDGDRIL